ncbi:MAG TPA: NADPH-dependent F420 reductase [Acidimicrobiales bacterium]|nr:NADPH-dependent F420 reductase [Acidimicrobiales bacterium]
MRIAVLGGTGPAGRALSARLASVGYEVVVGSRSKSRALEVRDDLLRRWPDHDLIIDGAENEQAAEADLVVIATPWEAAATTAASVELQLRGKPVVSMANALAKVGNEFQPLVPPRGSVAGNVQAAVPGAYVAAAFHHLPARELAGIDHPIDSDVLICSDHLSATEATAEVVRRIPGLRPLDAGGLSNAAPIEAFAAVLLQLNGRYKTRVAVKLTGIDDDGGA